MAKGSSNTEVRVFNQKRIVSLLFHEGPMTKKDIAERLGLSAPTVSVILASLAGKGLVVQGEKLPAASGRPPSHILLAFDHKVSIGIEVSGRHVWLALVDLGPRVIGQARRDLVYDGTADYWRTVRDFLDAFRAEHTVEADRLLGIGLSVQVPVEDGRPRPPASSREPREFWDFDLARAALGPDVEIHNDAKMASLAQVWGIGESRDVVYLLLGNGVGGAILSNRQIFHQGSKNAEFGHMVVRDDGLACTCGQRGCLGAYCSSTALEARAGVPLDAFFARLDEGDAAAAALWDEYLHHLAIGVHDLRMAFDTDVILGGEMTPHLERHLDDLRRRLAARNPFGDGGDYVRLAGYGEFDSAVGAALVHIDRYLS